MKAVESVWGLAPPSWLAAQVGQESGWRDGLTSSAGAMGMCQFMPATASGIEEQYVGLASWGRYSPRWCFYAQSLLMRDLHRQYSPGRTECDAMKFSGSGYNGGPTALNREINLCFAVADCDPKQWDENVATMNSRANWAWRENRTYVSRITAREGIYAAEGWGVTVCHPR